MDRIKRKGRNRPCDAQEVQQVVFGFFSVNTSAFVLRKENPERQVKKNYGKSPGLSSTAGQALIISCHTPTVLPH